MIKRQSQLPAGGDMSTSLGILDPDQMRDGSDDSDNMFNLRGVGFRLGLEKDECDASVHEVQLDDEDLQQLDEELEGELEFDQLTIQDDGEEDRDYADDDNDDDNDADKQEIQSYNRAAHLRYLNAPDGEDSTEDESEIDTEDELNAIRQAQLKSGDYIPISASSSDGGSDRRHAYSEYVEDSEAAYPGPAGLANGLNETDVDVSFKRPFAVKRTEGNGQHIQNTSRQYVPSIIDSIYLKPSAKGNLAEVTDSSMQLFGTNTSDSPVNPFDTYRDSLGSFAMGVPESGPGVDLQRLDCIGNDDDDADNTLHSPADQSGDDDLLNIETPVPARGGMMEDSIFGTIPSLNFIAPGGYCNPFESDQEMPDFGIGDAEFLDFNDAKELLDNEEIEFNKENIISEHDNMNDTGAIDPSWTFHSALYLDPLSDTADPLRVSIATIMRNRSEPLGSLGDEDANAIRPTFGRVIVSPVKTLQAPLLPESGYDRRLYEEDEDVTLETIPVQEDSRESLNGIDESSVISDKSSMLSVSAMCNVFADVPASISGEALTRIIEQRQQEFKRNKVTSNRANGESAGSAQGPGGQGKATVYLNKDHVNHVAKSHSTRTMQQQSNISRSNQTNTRLTTTSRSDNTLALAKNIVDKPSANASKKTAGQMPSAPAQKEQQRPVVTRTNIPSQQRTVVTKTSAPVQVRMINNKSGAPAAVMASVPRSTVSKTSATSSKSSAETSIASSQQKGSIPHENRERPGSVKKRPTGAIPKMCTNQTNMSSTVEMTKKTVLEHDFMKGYLTHEAVNNLEQHRSDAIRRSCVKAKKLSVGEPVHRPANKSCIVSKNGECGVYSNVTSGSVSKIPKTKAGPTPDVIPRDCCVSRRSTESISSDHDKSSDYTAMEELEQRETIGSDISEDPLMEFKPRGDGQEDDGITSTPKCQTVKKYPGMGKKNIPNTRDPNYEKTNSKAVKTITFPSDDRWKSPRLSLAFTSENRLNGIASPDEQFEQNNSPSLTARDLSVDIDDLSAADITLSEEQTLPTAAVRHVNVPTYLDKYSTKPAAGNKNMYVNDASVTKNLDKSSFHLPNSKAYNSKDISKVNIAPDTTLDFDNVRGQMLTPSPKKMAALQSQSMLSIHNHSPEYMSTPFHPQDSVVHYDELAQSAYGYTVSQTSDGTFHALAPQDAVTYRQGHSGYQNFVYMPKGPPRACPVRVPANLVFDHVCCVGVSVNATLSVHNPAEQWMKCDIRLVRLTVDGAAVDPDNMTPFMLKDRLVLEPNTTENITVAFIPNKASFYVGQLEIAAKPLVDSQTHIEDFITASVSLQAEAEMPNVKIAGATGNELQTLEFGDTHWGSQKSMPIQLINKGRADVPLRLTITSHSSSWHCFSFGRPSNNVSLISQTSRPPSRALNDTLMNIMLTGRSSLSDDLSDRVVTILCSLPERSWNEGLANRPPEVMSSNVCVEVDTPMSRGTINKICLTAVAGMVKLRCYEESLHLKSMHGKPVRGRIQFQNAGNINLRLNLLLASGSDVFSMDATEVVVPAHSFSCRDVVTFQPRSPHDAEHYSSMLYMYTLPQGPVFEMPLMGVGIVQKDAVICSNKALLTFGGVTVGDQRTEKLTLYNPESYQVKVTLNIDTVCPDFKMLMTYGDATNLLSVREVLLNAKQKLPINVLFIPSVATNCSSRISVKSEQSSKKYTIPLIGYGGVSKVSVCDLDTVTGIIDIGEISIARPSVLRLTLFNSGERTAFVKDLCFTDVTCVEFLQGSVMSVQPATFLLQPAETKHVIVVLNTTLREAALCSQSQATVAVIRFYSGDEVSRVNFRRSLKNGAINSYGNLPPEHPLRKTSFDYNIEMEHELHESVAETANDVSIFYKSMSKIQVSVVAEAPWRGPDVLPVSRYNINNEHAATQPIIMQQHQRTQTRRAFVSPPEHGTVPRIDTRGNPIVIREAASRPYSSSFHRSASMERNARRSLQDPSIHRESGPTTMNQNSSMERNLSITQENESIERGRTRMSQHSTMDHNHTRGSSSVERGLSRSNQYTSVERSINGMNRNSSVERGHAAMNQNSLLERAHTGMNQNSLVERRNTGMNRHASVERGRAGMNRNSSVERGPQRTQEMDGDGTRMQPHSSVDLINTSNVKRGLAHTYPNTEPPARDTNIERIHAARRARTTQRTTHVERPIVIQGSEILTFDSTAVGKSDIQKIEIRNLGDMKYKVEVVSPEVPFLINHNILEVRPRKFIRLPVEFWPKKKSYYKGLLILRVSTGYSLRVELHADSF